MTSESQQNPHRGAGRQGGDGGAATSVSVASSCLTYALQPLLLIGALCFWYFNQLHPMVYLLGLIGVQLVLGVLEYWFPARRDWMQSPSQKLNLVGIVAVVVVCTGLMSAQVDATLLAPLAQVRQTLHLDIWPHQWPLLIQLFMVFFLAEFLWYWLHRAEHRWNLFWRLTGHGAHHSFKNLSALNFGANHPLELFWLVLPAAVVGIVFDVGAPAAGAALLTGVQASIAHSNIPMNTRGIGLLFTTNEYHIHHHSMVLEESNTNYGCAAIVWDRLFGTFAAGPTAETGTGPREPSLWEKVVMPIAQPVDTSVAP